MYWFLVCTAYLRQYWLALIACSYLWLLHLYCKIDDQAAFIVSPQMMLAWAGLVTEFFHDSKYHGCLKRQSSTYLFSVLVHVTAFLLLTGERYSTHVSGSFICTQANFYHPGWWMYQGLTISLSIIVQESSPKRCFKELANDSWFYLIETPIETIISVSVQLCRWDNTC